MDSKKRFEDNSFESCASAEAPRMPKFTLAKMRLASHPDTPHWCLRRLSRHQNEKVVVRVAENPNTPVEVLEELAAHDNFNLRVALTDNLNTPIHVLLRLAVDENADVRYCLAENHNAPLSVLTVLCDDENPYVAARARQTLNRLCNSRNRSFSWFPLFRHKLGRQHRKQF